MWEVSYLCSFVPQIGVNCFKSTAYLFCAGFRNTKRILKRCAVPSKFTWTSEVKPSAAARARRRLERELRQETLSDQDEVETEVSPFELVVPASELLQEDGIDVCENIDIAPGHASVSVQTDDCFFRSIRHQHS